MNAEHVTSQAKLDVIGLMTVARLSQRGFMTASATVATGRIHPGAPHGFHADSHTSSREEAAEDAWQPMQACRQYKALG